MGLFDILDEIAEKQVTKTDTGDTRIFGVMVGLVHENYNANMPGRVCVEIPVRDKDLNVLQWARVAMPSHGPNWGHYFQPEKGDQVLLAFEQGYIEKPYVIGCVAKDANSFLRGAADEKNRFKKITTKYGNTIIFEDIEDGEGAKDKITVQTAKQAHTILMDNENHIIKLHDKENANFIEMNTEKGDITIQAKHRVTIKVGDNITLTMDGSNGSVQLDCTKLTVNTTDSINITATKNLTAKGANVTMDASSQMKVSSSGMTQISGSTLKM